MTTLNTQVFSVERWDFVPNGAHFLLFSDQAGAMVEVDPVAKTAIAALSSGDQLVDWVAAAAAATGLSEAEALCLLHPLLAKLERAGLIGLGQPPELVDWVSQLVEGDSKGQRTCYLSLTDACNLKCGYCYNEDEREDALACARKALSDREIRNLIDRLAEARFDYLVFTGGEPMLRKSIFDLAAYANSKGLGVNLLTNGTAFTKHNVHKVVEVFDSVTVSLDSAISAEHDITRGAGSWERIAKGLDLLVAAGLGATRLGLRPVVTVHNLDHIKLLPAYANWRWGVTSFLPSLYLPNSAEEVAELGLLPSPEAYQAAMALFNDELKAIPGALAEDPLRAMSYGGRCGMAESILSVSASGDVYPCQSLHDERLWLGNVRTGSVEAFFARGREIGVAGTTGLDVPECEGCVYQMLCGGGCRASAFRMAGHMTAHNGVMCRHLKTSAQSQLRRYAAFKRGQQQVETA